MSFPVLPDHITISTSEPESLHAVIDLVIRHHIDQVVTLTTRANPDGLTLTILPHEPGQQPGWLYGAAFLHDGDPQPPIVRPVIAYDEIRAIHLW